MRYIPSQKLTSQLPHFNSRAKSYLGCKCVYVCVSQEQTIQIKMKKFSVWVGLRTKSRHKEWKSTFKHDLFMHPSPKSVSVMFLKNIFICFHFCLPAFHSTVVIIICISNIVNAKRGTELILLTFFGASIEEKYSKKPLSRMHDYYVDVNVIGFCEWWRMARIRWIRMDLKNRFKMNLKWKNLNFKDDYGIDFDKHWIRNVVWIYSLNLRRFFFLRTLKTEFWRISHK